jgi:hypothetical protein
LCSAIVGIDGRADQFSAIQSKALDSGQKGGAFHDDLVAGADHGFAQQVQGLLAAGGDDQLIWGDVFGTLAGHEGSQLFAQRVIALSGAVLQCSAWLFDQCSVDRLLDAIHVKHGAIGKAARKADDAGLAQQLEEFADGGGFYVIQTIGKLQWHGKVLLGRFLQGNARY